MNESIYKTLPLTAHPVIAVGNASSQIFGSSIPGSILSLRLVMKCFSTFILFLLLFEVGQLSVTDDNSCYLVKEVCRINDCHENTPA